MQPIDDIAVLSGTEVKMRDVKGLLSLAAVFILLSVGCGRDFTEINHVKNTERIIGGHSFHGHESLKNTLVRVQSDENQVSCTGIAIAEDRVLTAAHCADLDAKVTNRFHEVLGRVVQIAEIKSDSKASKDVAVIYIDGRVKSYFSQPRLRNTNFRARRDVHIVGFISREEFVPSSVVKVVKTPDQKLNDDEWTVQQKDRSGACFGDSGSPVFQVRKNRYYLVGVVSRGYQDPFHTCHEASIFSLVNIDNVL